MPAFAPTFDGCRESAHASAWRRTARKILRLLDRLVPPGSTAPEPLPPDFFKYPPV